MQTAEKSSEEFKQIFLYEFTEEIIKNTRTYYLVQLEKLIEQKKIQRIVSEMPIETFTKEKIRDIIKSRSEEQKIRVQLKEGGFPQQIERFELVEMPKLRSSPKPIPRLLNIPIPRLPEKLNYLKPVPTEGVQISLGKLNPLMEDDAVNLIECMGPNEKIRVRTNTIRTTEIVLNSQEIEQVLEEFSKKSRIPVQEGLYNVVVGRFIFSADVSSSVGTRFTITKLSLMRNRPVMY